MTVLKGYSEDLLLSNCCKSKCRRGFKLAQDYDSIYCTRCGKKVNYFCMSEDLLVPKRVNDEYRYYFTPLSHKNNEEKDE